MGDVSTEIDAGALQVVQHDARRKDARVFRCRGEFEPLEAAIPCQLSPLVAVPDPYGVCSECAMLQRQGERVTALAVDVRCVAHAVVRRCEREEHGHERGGAAPAQRPWCGVAFAQARWGFLAGENICNSCGRAIAPAHKGL